MQKINFIILTEQADVSLTASVQICVSKSSTEPPITSNFCRQDSLSNRGIVAFWRTLGIVGSIFLEVEPHPVSTAFPVRTSSCRGRLTADTFSLKMRGVLSLRIAMSCGATPLKKRKIDSIWSVAIDVSSVCYQLRKYRLRESYRKRCDDIVSWHRLRILKWLYIYTIWLNSLETFFL